MYGTFGEYMFSLLMSPLRRASKAVNQWRIFFKVVGRLFDGAKQDFFRARSESLIISCSEVMLPVHGQDRNMPRLKGESAERYRLRLLLKFNISVEAGTDNAIRYIAKGFGYDNVEISKDEDPEKWAEATVAFVGGALVIDDRDLLLQELNKTKRARTRLNLLKEQRYTAALYVGTACMKGKTFTLRQV